MKSEKASDSSKTTPVKIDYDKIWEDAKVVRNWCSPDVIPEGFKTTVQIAKLKSVSERTARSWLKVRCDLGDFESKKFTVAKSDGTVQRISHYRPTEAWVLKCANLLKPENSQKS